MMIETTKTFTFDANIYSDLYKDTYGFRPRYSRFYDADITDEERQEMWDDLMVEHSAEMERYDAALKDGDLAFEKLIADTISHGAGDRQTAIRWIIQGCDFDEYDMNMGFGYFQYINNISDKYREEVNAVFKLMS